ncbi:hypothetical protein DUNSADRAFT_18614 [Dunaliella salina]|uniref:Uncharacterized protein n=1 Tax=Dunaliella salina TaxID=3046 RepID=A0ABQ7FZT0_DUNSA|nr:hypothetical protein DUNSADRAFT_18614 [Dunaliella salina]|eukprot:KAF5827859.1 hypothetical protein DUNSADRAFT_18614 [Dunaliella salina]
MEKQSKAGGQEKRSAAAQASEGTWSWSQRGGKEGSIDCGPLRERGSCGSLCQADKGRVAHKGLAGCTRDVCCA